MQENKALPSKWKSFLPEEQRNQTVTFLEVNKFYDSAFTLCKEGVYYPYNLDV